MTRTWIVAVLVASSAAAGGCSLGGESDKAGGERRPEAVALTLANHEESSLDLDEFAHEVERLSNGSVRIEFSNRWRESDVDYEPLTIEDVRTGKADLAKVSARAFDLVGVKSLQPYVAPFAVDSYALQREVLHSALPERMLGGVERLDLVGIALLPGELRKPVGVSRPLVEARDYRGAVIATRLSELGLRTFRALGATGEAIVPGSDTSSFDGFETDITGLQDDYDGSPRMLAANVNLWPRALVIVMNRDAYKRLSDDQREALRAAGRAAIDPALQHIREREREALGILCGRAEPILRSATRSQLDALRSATSSLTRNLERDTETRDVSREIGAMRAGVEAEPNPACPHEDRPSPAEGETPVDGLWRMNATADELARIAAPGDVVPENWGESTFALVAGRFAFTTENRDACIWARGQYAVKGSVVDWIVEDGGGISPSDALNSPGEKYSFTWSRYRDRLTLHPAKGAISPVPMRVKPWRLVDQEPSLGALSSRCAPPREALQP